MNEQPCYYCGKSFDQLSGWLDRIDNNIGYKKDNILPCCKFCNKLRGEILTVDETKLLVSTLMEYRKTKNNFHIVIDKCLKQCV